MRKLAVVLLVSLPLVSGCVTYRAYPDASTAAAPVPGVAATYRYDGSPGMFGGGNGLKDAFRNAPVFYRMERVQQPVDEGVFIDVTVKILPPSIPAIGFGYLSFSTLTLLPAWSTRDGYEVLFDLYRDGRRVRSFDYTFYRGSFVWLPMVLFIWVNALTPSEESAFEAVAEQFLLDAGPYLRP